MIPNLAAISNDPYIPSVKDQPNTSGSSGKEFDQAYTKTKREEAQVNDESNSPTSEERSPDYKEPSAKDLFEDSKETNTSEVTSSTVVESTEPEDTPGDESDPTLAFGLGLQGTEAETHSLPLPPTDHAPALVGEQGGRSPVPKVLEKNAEKFLHQPSAPKGTEPTITGLFFNARAQQQQTISEQTLSAPKTNAAPVDLVLETPRQKGQNAIPQGETRVQTGQQGETQAAQTIRTPQVVAGNPVPHPIGNLGSTTIDNPSNDELAPTIDLEALDEGGTTDILSGRNGDTRGQTAALWQSSAQMSVAMRAEQERASPDVQPDLSVSGDQEALETLVRASEPLLTPSGQSTSGNPAMRADASQIASQLSAAVLRNGAGQFEVALNPPELGRLRIVLESVDSGMVISISADKSETMDLIRRHVDQLEREFKELGYDSLAFNFSSPEDPPGEHETEQESVPLVISDVASDAPSSSDQTHASDAPREHGRIDIRL